MPPVRADNQAGLDFIINLQALVDQCLQIIQRGCGEFGKVKWLAFQAHPPRIRACQQEQILDQACQTAHLPQHAFRLQPGRVIQTSPITQRFQSRPQHRDWRLELMRCIRCKSCGCLIRGIQPGKGIIKHHGEPCDFIVRFRHWQPFGQIFYRDALSRCG